MENEELPFDLKENSFKVKVYQIHPQSILYKAK